jgi:hypothetical protein
MNMFLLSVAFVCLASSEANAPDSSATLPVYTYNASLSQLGTSGVSGQISIFATWWGLVGIGSASGLEMNLRAIPQGTNCSAKNGCGVHVHSGTACTDSQAQGGHFYTAGPPDPWEEVRYSSTDANGSASFSFSVNIGTKSIDGKAFVLHDNAGNRVACGILSRVLDAKSASLAPLSNSGVAGGVTVFSTPSRIVGAGWAHGLEADLLDSTHGGSNCSAKNGCGAHVHSGSGCSTSVAQGGHLKTMGGSDPWTTIRYSSTNSSGWASFVFSVQSDNTDVLGKPFVVHNNAGGRVSCGVMFLASVATSTSTTSLAANGTNQTPVGALSGATSKVLDACAILLCVMFLHSVL